jgi:hypothetical protein
MHSVRLSFFLTVADSAILWKLMPWLRPKPSNQMAWSCLIVEKSVSLLEYLNSEALV